MSISLAAPIAQALTRATLTTFGALTILLGSPARSLAQDSTSQSGRWSLRVPGGAFVPTGSQRNSLDDAHVTAVQISRLVRPRLALTSMVSWARSRDVAGTDAPKLDVFTSDLGIEARSNERFTDGPLTFSAFAGLGAGVRSYNYRKLDVDARHNLAGYGSVGGELGMGRVGLRFEVRDYATGFKPLVGSGQSRSRNDVVMMAALGFSRNRQ